MSTSGFAAISGHYQLHPGARVGVVGARPVLERARLRQWLRGQRSEQVGRSLGMVFSLCAHAHRRCAHLVMRAAQGESTPPWHAATPASMRWQTARDHLRSMALDWPHWLPHDAASVDHLQWLQGSPVALAQDATDPDEATASAALRQLRQWMEQHVLRQTVSDWLVQHGHADSLAQWCVAQSSQVAPALCLTAWHGMASGLRPVARFLEVLHTDAAQQEHQLRELAYSLMHDEHFAQAPQWQGACAETGPWSRLRAQSAPNAWSRLSARWLELLTLLEADTANTAIPVLCSGALMLSPGQAIAWCEMARGLLVHAVQLDNSGAVLDYAVLAPTEWNFHPQGALARAVSALPAAHRTQARVLAAAYDPCVACTIEPRGAPALTQATHA